MSYTPDQEEVMTYLESKLTQGEYYMIRAPKGDMEEQGRLMEARLGKPWAMIQYHEAMENTFFTNLIRAFIVNSLAIGFLCWIMMQMTDLTMKNAIITSIMVGLIGYLTINYIDGVWFQIGTIPDLIDAIVPWAATGAWLGFWVKK